MSSAPTSGPAAPPAEAPRILRKPGPLAPASLDTVPRATTTKMATLASQVAAGTAPASVLPPPSLTTPSRPPPSHAPDHSAVSTSSRPAPIGEREVTQPFIVHPDITSPLSRSSGTPAAPGPTQQVAPSQQPPRTSPSIFETAPMLPSIPELRTAPAAPRPAAAAPFPAPVPAPLPPPPPPSAPQPSTARMPSVPTPMPMPAPTSAPPAQPTPLFVPQPVALRAPQKPDIDEVNTEPERMIPQRPPVVSPPSFASSSPAPLSSLPPLQATMPAPAPIAARPHPAPAPMAAPLPAPAPAPSAPSAPKPTWAAPAKTAVPDAVKPTRVDYASWWRQWFAAIVDGIGVVAVIAGLLRVGFAVADLKPTVQTLIDTLHGNLFVLFPVVIAFPIGFALWHLLAVPLKGTVGQRLVGLRLVNGRGKPANVVRLVIRALVNGVFGALFLVGPAYALLLDGRRRGPGDIVARTVAVYRPRAKR